MLAGLCRAGLAREHPGELYESLLARDLSGSGNGPPFLLSLCHDHLRVRESSHLGEVGDDEHLMSGGREPVERVPDRKCRLAAHPGVDLVEHEGRWSLAQHETGREHDPCQLAARGNPVQRKCRLSRVRGKKPADVVPLARADHDLEAATWHCEICQMAGNRSSETASDSSAGVAETTLGFD